MVSLIHHIRIFMNNLFQMSRENVLAFSKNSTWFLIWGIALSILGMLAIYYAAFTTLISIVLLGIILVVSGIVIIMDAFHFWRGKGSYFFVNLLIGVLYLITGALLIKGPGFASISLTLLLSIFYIALGIFRTIYYLSHDTVKRGWGIFSGIIALILGVLIFAQWPMSGLFIIGLFIGIELLFCGWVYIMAALSAKALTNE